MNLFLNSVILQKKKKKIVYPSLKIYVLVFIHNNPDLPLKGYHISNINVLSVHLVLNVLNHSENNIYVPCISHFDNHSFCTKY